MAPNISAPSMRNSKMAPRPISNILAPSVKNSKMAPSSISNISAPSSTGCSRWMCRILDWYGGYAFRLWEILKWFPSHTDVYIWLSSEMFGIFRWIKSEKWFFLFWSKMTNFWKKLIKIEKKVFSDFPLSKQM